MASKESMESPARRQVDQDLENGEGWKKNIFNKKSFLKMCEINNLEFCNSLKLRKQSLFSKIKIIKNDFLFNNILIKNKN